MYSGECDVKKAQELERYLLKKYRFIRHFVIGKTVLSRRINAYTVGKRGAVLFCGAFHGAERITAMMLYKFLDDICMRMIIDREFGEIMKEVGLTVVPMVNPDGVEISANGVISAKQRSEFVSDCIVREGTTHRKWQANARGVDINHNFDAGYERVKINEKNMGITVPSSTRYGGEYPESENETAALCELCRQNHFELASALHTQGREIYYDYGIHTPNESFHIAQKLSELSGYTVSKPEGIAVGGGFKDWFIDEFHCPAFTLEIGEGVNPLSPIVFSSEYESVSKTLSFLLEYEIKKQRPENAVF